MKTFEWVRSKTGDGTCDRTVTIFPSDHKPLKISLPYPLQTSGLIDGPDGPLRVLNQLSDSSLS